MRQYRGRIKDSTVWVYGYYTKSPQGIARIWSPITKDNGESYLYDYVVDPETVGQSTGLKDKNGHEAYEGDIFVDLTDGYRWSIAYMDGYYCAISGDETLMLHEFLENGKLDAETIGNIHDHPHLLQGEGQ